MQPPHKLKTTVHSEIREGEVALPFDPGLQPPDAGIVFIGHIASPWHEKAGCPHSLREARERNAGGATVHVAAPYRLGLTGLAAHSHILLLYWLDRSRRDLVLQHPRRAKGANGVFALRTPLRPNPIGLAAVRLLSLDAERGELAIDAIDCLDGTPLIDIKPYVSRVDSIAGQETR